MLTLYAPLQDVQAALPEAVACMRQYMVQRQAAFAAQTQQRLQGTLADLERLQAAQVQQLELRLEKQLEQMTISSTSGCRRCTTLVCQCRPCWPA